MPGDLSWRLGAHFEPKALIFVILETFPGQILIPLEVIFEHFFDAYFRIFSDALLEGTFCQIWCQKHQTWEAFGGHFDDILGDRLFLDF